MKITIESTDKIVELNGVPARIWEGETDSRIPVHVFVTRIAVAREADTAQFSAELVECAAPSADVAAYPFRMFLHPEPDLEDDDYSHDDGEEE